MNTISITPIVMATLIFYVGFYHFSIYRRKKDSRENLTFALSGRIIKRSRSLFLRLSKGHPSYSMLVEARKKIALLQNARTPG